VQRFEELAQRYLGISPELGYKILATIGIVLAYLVVRRLSRRVFQRLVDDKQSRYELSKAIAYLAGLLAVLALLKVWFSAGITGFATYLGLLSAGLAVALQDPLINFAGWLFILVRRPFQVGDRIQLGPHSGDVVDVRLFRFVMLEIGQWVNADQSTGRVLHVPNGWVFKHPIANYDGGFGYIWNELEVIVTFESDWQKAKELLLRTVNDHAEHLSADAVKRIEEAADHFHIKFSKVTPVVWTSVVESGVRLTMRYLCKPRERRSSASEIWEALLEGLSKMPDVHLAYPTTRFVGDAPKS
jgi:small-conductance mechanosensitive channel